MTAADLAAIVQGAREIGRPELGNEAKRCATEMVLGFPRPDVAAHRLAEIAQEVAAGLAILEAVTAQA